LVLDGSPLTTATFALNRVVGGLEPSGWHAANLAIHLGAVVLAYLFARVTLARAGVSQPETLALAAAALFALHPMQTEAVAYVTQRAESLASAVYLSAMLVALASDSATTRRGRTALVAAATALHAAGLGAKPIMATFPAAWLLHAAILPASGEEMLSPWQRVRRRVPAALPSCALSVLAAISAIRGTAGSSHAGYGIAEVSAADFLATQMRVVPTYIRLLVWPIGQCGDWQFRVSHGFLEPAVVGGAALLLAIAAAAVYAAVRSRTGGREATAAKRATSFGLLFFLLALTPSSSIVPLQDTLAEHRVYLASLGLFIAAAAGGADAMRRFVPRRRAMVGVALTVALLSAAAVATAHRASVWSTALAFWADAAEKAPEKVRVQVKLGEAYVAAHRLDEALATFIRARDLPDDHRISREAIVGHIVLVLNVLGRTAEARVELERESARNPRDPDQLATRAQVEYHADNDEECERAALAALALNPRHAKALKYLGLLRMKRNDLAGARDAFRAAAATHVVDPLVYLALGSIEARTGDSDAACRAYASAIGQPGNAWASRRAAEARATLPCR
jgi:tetratricopeptide (TPR) repeat protein